MDLPDYTAATDALDLLGTDHHGQHRCTDGGYYTPSTWVDCPINTALATVSAVLVQTRELPHTAAHDDATMYAVAEAMSGIELRAVPCEVDTEIRLGWLTMARLGGEALAAELDPAAATS